MYYKNLSLIFCLLCYCSIPHLYANIVVIDSLKQEINDFIGDTISVTYAELLYELAKAEEKEGAYQKSYNICERAITITAQSQADRLHFRLLMLEGKCCYFLSSYHCSAEKYSSALGMEGDFIMPKDSARIFSQLGYVAHHFGNLEKAHAYQIKALKIYERLGDPFLISQYYYAEGLIFIEQKKFEKALTCYKISLELYQSSGETQGVSDWYSVIGEAYHEMDSLDQALFYKKKAFQIDSLQDYEYGLGYGYYSLALTYTKLQQLEKAMRLHKKGYQIRQEIGDKEETAKSLAAIGGINLKFKNYNLAIQQLEEALGIAKAIETKPLIKDIYQQLAEASYEKGNYKNAYNFQQEYFILRDSITNENSLQSIANLKSKHQVDKQQQQIALLQKDQEMGLMHRNLSIVGFILLFCFIAYRLRHSKKQSNYNKLLKAKNEEIKKQNLQLQTANEDLEQFAYISSHDLKAPLRTIGSYASLLNRRYKKQLDATGVEFLEFITNGVKQMNTLLEDIYDYTRLDKEALNFSPVDLNMIVEKVRLSLGYTIQERQAIIEVENLPTIYGNMTLLGQVFQNLIDNGMKFMVEGKEPRINISTKIKNDFFQICIQDNGIGIAEDYHDKIFTVFRRLHNDSEYKGTGVGLAICKKIIEKHGGEIWVESDGVNGSCFCFTLPIVPNTLKEKELTHLELVP